MGFVEGKGIGVWVKNKKLKLIVFLVVLISLFSYSTVYACLILEPTILVKCSNLETSIVPYKYPDIGESYEEFQIRWTNEITENLHEVVPNCKEDLSPVIDDFELEIIKWADYKNRRFLLDRNLILEPYSALRDSEIKKNKKDLFSCEYEESKRVDNWLIIFETGRTYCSSWHAPTDPCPSVVLSLANFLFYLLTTFSLATLPYQLGVLLTVLITIYVWWKLLRKRPAMQNWKIITLSIIILTLELFLIIFPFWILGQMIGLILVVYIFVLYYKKIISIRNEK